MRGEQCWVARAARRRGLSGARRRAEPAAGQGSGSGASRTRTDDLLGAIQALFQLSYSPAKPRVADWQASDPSTQVLPSDLAGRSPDEPGEPPQSLHDPQPRGNLGAAERSRDLLLATLLEHAGWSVPAGPPEASRARRQAQRRPRTSGRRPPRSRPRRSGSASPGAHVPPARRGHARSSDAEDLRCRRARARPSRRPRRGSASGERHLREQLSRQLGGVRFGNAGAKPEEDRLLPAQESSPSASGSSRARRIRSASVSGTSSPYTPARRKRFQRSAHRGDDDRQRLSPRRPRSGLRPASERRRARRRALRVAAISGVTALVVAGAAFATATLLGWPAPDHVKKEIAAVDRGLPEDLRLNPDVEHASAVASSGSSTLYAASLKDGGHCTELVTPDDRGRGATCSTGSDQSFASDRRDRPVRRRSRRRSSRDPGRQAERRAGSRARDRLR